MERLTDFAIAAFLWAFRIVVVVVVVVGSLLTLASGKYSLATWIDLIGSGLERVARAGELAFCSVRTSLGGHACNVSADLALLGLPLEG